jgi:hypothetical protein
MSATGVNAGTEPYYLSNSKNLFAQTLLLIADAGFWIKERRRLILQLVYKVIRLMTEFPFCYYDT